MYTDYKYHKRRAEEFISELIRRHLDSLYETELPIGTWTCLEETDEDLNRLSVVKIINRLRAINADYTRTKNKADLNRAKRIIASLNKPMIKKLKKLIRANLPDTNTLEDCVTDLREKIRSLIQFSTNYFSLSFGGEENSYTIFNNRTGILFFDQQQLYEQQGRISQIN